MKLYYLQSEYQAGKHRIVKCLYDDEVFKFDEGTLSPYSAIMIDEINQDNKALCIDLYRTQDRVDANGENKYYAGSTGALMEVGGWAEHAPEAT